MKNRHELLVDRIKKLPREEVEQYARIFERRAADQPKSRNNVSARIAMALRLYLNEKLNIKSPSKQ